MDLGRSIQVLSMKSVLDKDYEYLLRSIFRWYSKTFHTPLHIVEELPVEEILQHYYESIYAELEDHERDEELARILETDEERLARIATEARKKKQETESDQKAFEQAVQKSKEMEQKRQSKLLRGPLDKQKEVERATEAILRPVHTPVKPPLDPFDSLQGLPEIKIPQNEEFERELARVDTQKVRKKEEW